MRGRGQHFLDAAFFVGVNTYSSVRKNFERGRGGQRRESFENPTGDPGAKLSIAGGHGGLRTKTQPSEEMGVWGKAPSR